MGDGRGFAAPVGRPAHGCRALLAGVPSRTLRASAVVRHTSALDRARGGQAGEEARRLSAQEREVALSIEIGNLERRHARNGFSRPAARRVHGRVMRLGETEVDLGWRGAAQALVRPGMGVVDEALVDTTLEVHGVPRPERGEAQTLLQGSPQPFDEGDGSGLADGAETLANRKSLQPLTKQRGGEPGKKRRG